jgi:hypothetical protein
MATKKGIAAALAIAAHGSSDLVADSLDRSQIAHKSRKTAQPRRRIWEKRQRKRSFAPRLAA